MGIFLNKLISLFRDDFMNQVREQQTKVSALHGEMSALAHYQNQLLTERNHQLESARRSIEDLENRLAGSNARLEQVRIFSV
jgi:hypothetical protein